MKPPLLLGRGLLACALLLRPVWAQTPQPAPTLSHAFESAWQRALSRQEAGAQRRLAEAERQQAGRLWAAPPALELSQNRERGNGSGVRETELGLAWPLWLPGQRDAQQASADAALGRAEALQAEARLRLAGELREQHWQLAALQAEAAQTERQQALLERLAADVERRLQAGELAATDALAVRAEALAGRAALAQAQQSLREALARWRLLSGGEPAAALPEPVPEGELPEQHPSLQVAAAQTTEARKQLSLQQRSGREAPELRLAWRQEQAGGGAARQNGVGLALRLPLGAERQQPKLAEAASAVEAAELGLERARERLHSELVTARDALRAAQARQQIEAEQAALLRRRAELLDKAFRAGETALPELLRALVAAAQAEAAAARQQAALGLAQARVQQAFGQLP